MEIHIEHSMLLVQDKMLFKLRQSSNLICICGDIFHRWKTTILKRFRVLFVYGSNVLMLMYNMSFKGHEPGIVMFKAAV